MECGNSYNEVFAIYKEVLPSSKGSSLLPDHTSSEELATRFETFFKEKIANLRASL